MYQTFVKYSILLCVFLIISISSLPTPEKGKNSDITTYKYETLPNNGYKF